MKQNDELKIKQDNIGAIPQKKLGEHSKKLIAILIVSQILIVFFIKIINLRLFNIIGSILGIIILITLLYKIITEK